MRGIVTLLEANRPTVQTAAGDQYLCYLKGRIKRDIGRIMVGDEVEFEPTEANEARIDQVLPRTSQLTRPPLANVTGLFVVFSVSHPQGSLEMLDKRLVMAHLAGLQAEILLSKWDILEDPRWGQEIAQLYRSIGYSVWTLGLDDEVTLREWLSTSRQGIWVLTGESGVGKSTWLNRVLPEAQAQMNTLSRIGRGQQTTRWVRLYPMSGFWLADSPGYTALDVKVTDSRQIASAFWEFEQYRCRFLDCLHGQEPGCGVVQAVTSGDIAEFRYQHYRKLLAEWVHGYS